MSYDTLLAARLRAALGPLPELVEKAMFGGVGFLLNGNMACGVHKNDLIVRVGPASYAGALSRPHT
jgi:TfoX/Sxy family transcriptional regulator of competence genes